MTGHELPGIPGLRDPHFDPTESAALPDLQIAPLRNPEPLKYSNAPVPLEPIAEASVGRHQVRSSQQHRSGKQGRLPSNIKPSDVLQARESKKPNLAISELVDRNQDEQHFLQLPSFVSLSVVEKSPIPQPSQINPNKRLRYDNEGDGGVVEMNRVLPRPSKKDENQKRPVPLLPAMVTGLHEPPPSAGLLPSMSDARPELSRPGAVSKMNVKEILVESRHASGRRPPEAMINFPEVATAALSQPNEAFAIATDKTSGDEKNSEPLTNVHDSKARRQYRKWTDQETADLVSGVQKYGSGKWKQILSDPAYSFGKRTAVDLKDRYRVLPKDIQRRRLSSQADDTNDQQNHPQIQQPDNNLVEVALTSPRHRKKRQRWTFAEDAALMTGVSKHGFQWSAIHSDTDLEWGSRRPTDLRDRIRTLFPEGYKRADTRPLAKERNKIEKPQNESTELGDPTSDNSSQEAKSSGSKRDNAKDQMQEIAEVGNKPKDSRESSQPEHTGINLPSLALDDDHMEWDNRLPPLLDWEEI